MKALAGRAADGLSRTGLLSLLEAFERTPNRLRAIAYHRIDEPEAEPDLDPGLVSATPDEFAAQLELLARRYRVISLDELLAAHRGGTPLPPKAVLLSFDDAYHDFAEQAWPILRRFGLPATLFVPTAFPDVSGPGFWWDRLHAALARSDRRSFDVPGLGTMPLGTKAERRAAHRAIRGHVKSLPHDQAMARLDEWIDALAALPSLHRVLGWETLRRLAREGVAVCSHSDAHALCTRLEPEALAEDLARSRARLADELGDDARTHVFAYPASAQDARSRRVVREAGFELAFGGGRSIDRLPLAEPHHVPRLPMLRYSTGLFRAQLRPAVTRLGRLLVDGRAARSA